MPIEFQKIKKSFWLWYTFLRRCNFFYRSSLDKRHSVFSSDKFIDDPWPGNVIYGQNILKGKSHDASVPIDISDFLLNMPASSEFANCAKYINCFCWIRDIQSVGGNKNRKYVRKLIILFINNYRAKKRFWNNKLQWSNSIVGERLTNLVLTYSFVSSGSSDEFQKKFLAALNEQYSHLLKSYKGEANLFSKLLAVKGLICCLSVMKNTNKRRIKTLLKEFKFILFNIFDSSGFFKSRNPTELFNVFRSILEIRFVIKRLKLNLMDETFWEKSISTIASSLRILRFGNGELSEFQGDFKYFESFLKPSSQIIDAALSLADFSKVNQQFTMKGIERLASKKIVVLLNTQISKIKSKFNNSNEPGLNVFDFEASFGDDKIINRADVSILFNKFRLRTPENSTVFSKKSVLDNGIFFEGETQSLLSKIPFAFRKEIFVDSKNEKIKCLDLFYSKNKVTAFIRIVFNKTCEIQKINDNYFIINIASRKYKLTLSHCDFIKQSSIKESNTFLSIEFEIENCNSEEFQIEWEMENLVK